MADLTNRERYIYAQYLLACLDLQAEPGRYIHHPFVAYLWQFPPSKLRAILELIIQSKGLYLPPYS